MEGKAYFADYFRKRGDNDTISFWETPPIKKAYFTGAYSRAVVMSSWNSKVSKKNITFGNWLSNQIINYRNLDRIFEMAFRFEQKLKLNIRNDSEVRKLAHEIPATKSTGISSAKISYAFVAGYDDYNKFVKENPSIKPEENKSEGE